MSGADYAARAIVSAIERIRQRYVLQLFVTGATPRSVLAIQNVRALCEKHLPGRYDLEVVDLYQQPRMAEGENILAAPTLVKKAPLPARRFVGDMSDTPRLLAGLELLHTGEPPSAV